MAPLAPFTSDWLHRALTGESVHLAEFPAAGRPSDAGLLERSMDAVRRLANLGRAAREEAGVRVRQPLAVLYAVVPRAADRPLRRSATTCSTSSATS
jgi:isoleucyl-tRNA synthetase